MASSKAFFRAFGHMFHVAASLSINTGVAPKYKIGLHEAEKVRVEQKTMSPSPTPNAFNPR